MGARCWKDKRLRRKPAIELKVINIRDIKDKARGKSELNLKGYKLLSSGELKEKIKIVVSAASQSAIDKIKKAGGDVIIE